MKLSENNIKKIEQDFSNRIPFLGDRTDEILKGMQLLDGDKRIAMQFLYAYMPFSDVGDYDYSMFLSYVDHAMFLVENSLWKKEVSDEYFLHYILFHRSSSEEIVDCRRMFYDSLIERVQGMTMVEAALEVNNWCLEQATYQMNDSRTASPLTVCRSGLGRCGEESILLVTALRSIGIPARQIFVPRWSHCDDNHAWVEVWCDGKWYFTGACEPNPILNQGWFTVPASRAMLVESRGYSDTCLEDEDIVQSQGRIYLNNTSLYAKTCRVTVTVVDKTGSRVANALVHFEVVNFAEFFPIAVLKTDEKGQVEITLGLGSIHILVIKDHKLVRQIINTKLLSQVELCIDSDYIVPNEFTMIAPTSEGVVFETATKEQEEKQSERNKNSEEIRLKRIEDSYDAAYVEQYKDYPKIQEALKGAKGNFNELRWFLESNARGDLYWKEKLLQSLAVKDYTDVQADMLLKHLTEALAFKDNFDEEIFVKYILCPRIHLEVLSSYRDYIQDYFSMDEKCEFQANPNVLWEYIEKNIEKPDVSYSMQLATPIGTLKIKKGITLSKKVLFVAILRTLGIPAQIYPIDESIRYYKDGDFQIINRKVELDCRSKVHVSSLVQKEPGYYQQWTIGIKEEQGTYKTLDLSDEKWIDGTIALMIEPGDYRVITVNRLVNGNLLTKLMYFTVLPDQEVKIELQFPEIYVSDQIKSNRLPEITLKDLQGIEVNLSAITDSGTNVIIWVEEGQEPTEHILNEILDKINEINSSNIQIYFCVKDKKNLENITLNKTIEALSNCSVLIDNTVDNLSLISAATGVDSNIKPYLLVTKMKQVSMFAMSGYNVGTVDLLLKMISV